MNKRKTYLKRLNEATVELQQAGVWLIEEAFVARLRDAMCGAWSAKDGDPESLAVRMDMHRSRTSSPDSELLQIVDGIGVVQISGMLFPRENVWTWYGFGTAATSILDAVTEAMARDDVRGVMLWIDSPGGRAAGIFEAVRAIRLASESSGKPIWSIADGQAASGGYAYATAGTRIFASPSTVVGSVGAIMVHTQFRPENATFTVVRYGENKALGTPYESFSERAAAQWKLLVDGTGQQFEDLVAQMRGVSVQTVQERFGRGGVFFGQDAQTRGLIDAVVEMPEAAIEQFRRFVGNPSSGSTAGVRAEGGVGASQGANTQQKDEVVSKKLKAALFVAGLVADMDVSDDVGNAALTAFFAGRGVERPKDEAAVIAALQTKAVDESLHRTTNTSSGGNAGGGSTGVAPNVAEAHRRELEEARAAGRKDEAARVADIRARGKALQIEDAKIESAISEGLTAAQAVDAWTKELSESRKPLHTTVTESGAIAFERDAVDALLIRCGRTVENASDQARRMGRAGVPMIKLAQMSLSTLGIRVGDFADNEAIAAAALKAGVSTFSETVMVDDSGSVNRPGSYPNLLSALSNKLFDEGVESAETSYREWTGRTPGDLPDLKPAPLMGRGTLYQLDEVIDDEKLRELKIDEEVLSTVQVRRFKNKFGWTPTMVANDDLGAFAEGMLGFGEAADQTINLLCLQLLTGNVTLLDGYQLIDGTNHGNAITSGAGAPSVAQWKLMQNKFSKQKRIGGKGYLRGSLRVLLCPPQLAPEGRVLLAPFGDLPEMKTPATQAEINVYRGSGRVVAEPELQSVSETAYYGMLDPARNPTVVRVHQRGWGEGPRRTSWVDPETGTAWTAYEVRVGAAVRNYRTLVYNPGA